MIEFDDIVDAADEIEKKPDNDYRSKAAGEFMGSEWLSEKEKDENCTRDANDDICDKSEEVVEIEGFLYNIPVDKSASMTRSP